MITVAEEVERALKLATEHQNLKSENHQNKKLTFPVNETTDCITLSSDEDDEVQDVNMGALGGNNVKEKAKVVLPNEKKKSGESKVRRENKFQAARLPDSSGDEDLKQLKHVAEMTTGHSPMLLASSSKHKLSESDEEDPQPQPAFAGHHQQNKPNASPDPQIAVPSSGPHQRPIDTRPPVHCVTPAQEPMLSCSHFDGSIVLCEEVRVKVERPDTLEEARDPLFCESKNVDVSVKGKGTGGNEAPPPYLQPQIWEWRGGGEGVNHAVKIKDCRVMLQRKILDKKSASKHVIVHRGIQPNKTKCKVVGCEKPFFHRLGVHMRMMHGQPKLKCGNCDVEFYSRQGLKRHIVSKHEIRS